MNDRFLADVSNRRERRKMLGDLASEADRRIGGVSGEWGLIHGRRLDMIVERVLSVGREKKDGSVRILNASGMSKGQFDFPLLTCLRHCLEGGEISWTAVEHPESSYLKNPCFQEQVKNLGIEVKCFDLNRAGPACPILDGRQYDVVLLTEILEHLDYTTAVRWIAALREIVAPNGILIITTPNLCRISNRIRMLFGRDELGYFGDGWNEVRQGLLGHVVYWGVDRLERLLDEIGFEVVEKFYFNQGRIYGRGQWREKGIGLLMDAWASMVPRGKTHFMMVARIKDGGNGA
ncbi:MAG: methyltransferase domain-containing protein [Verrucomicrobiae bacterium]|nr:methyltransferase domain-containing protein [Verrucomicrobiae bacterium]